MTSDSTKDPSELYPAIYAVYDHPHDYPEYYVVRRWYGEYADDRLFIQSKDLRVIHQILFDMGLNRLHAYDAAQKLEDPVVIEQWI